MWVELKVGVARRGSQWVFLSPKASRSLLSSPQVFTRPRALHQAPSGPLTAASPAGDHDCLFLSSLRLMILLGFWPHPPTW